MEDGAVPRQKVHSHCSARADDYREVSRALCSLAAESHVIREMWYNIGMTSFSQRVAGLLRPRDDCREKVVDLFAGCGGLSDVTNGGWASRFTH